jgi:hypothetical protein
MEFLENARKFFYGGNTSSQHEVLNQDLQYLLKYNERIGVEEVNKLVGTPYDIMMPYFGLKLLRDNPPAQQKMLATIANLLHESPGYTTTAQRIKDFFLEERPEIKEVSPKKISRVAVWGPSLVHTQAEKRAEEIKQSEETPVLIAYTGFFALKPFVENLSANSKILTVLPERIASHLPIGYALKNSGGAITVEEIDRSSLLLEENVALVDDTVHTGDTINKVSELFQHSHIHEAPLFRT